MVIAMLTYEKICVAYKFLKLFYLEEVIALIFHIYFSIVMWSNNKIYCLLLSVMPVYQKEVQIYSSFIIKFDTKWLLNKYSHVACVILVYLFSNNACWYSLKKDEKHVFFSVTMYYICLENVFSNKRTNQFLFKNVDYVKHVAIAFQFSEILHTLCHANNKIQDIKKF